MQLANVKPPQYADDLAAKSYRIADVTDEEISNDVFVENEREFLNSG